MPYFYGMGILAAFAQAEIMVFVTQGVLKDLREEMFNHMQSLPIKYFDTHSHGDIMSMYTNDIDTLRQMVSQSLPQIINSVITVVSDFRRNVTVKCSSYSCHNFYDICNYYGVKETDIPFR